MFKYTIPRVLISLFPSCTWKVKTWDKVIFLTFDDGPHPQITPWVIQQLNDFQAKATFFCVGDNVRKYPNVYQQILEAKQGVGNHTMHHVKGWQLSDNQYLNEVKKASSLIQSKLFRPPYGRIKLSQLKKLRGDYKIIMWSKLSRDYDANLNIAESIAAMKKINSGDIIVFHDSEKAFPQLKQLLPALLAHYSKLGFKMEVLT